MGDKRERYRKGHESHYIYGPRIYSVEYSALYTPRPVGNEMHSLCGTARTYLQGGTHYSGISLGIIGAFASKEF